MCIRDRVLYRGGRGRPPPNLLAERSELPLASAQSRGPTHVGRIRAASCGRGRALFQPEPVSSPGRRSREERSATVVATTRLSACPKRPLVAVLISAAVLVGPPAGIAAADPPLSPDQVAAQIVALETQAEQATEAYNGAHLALEETQRRLEAAGSQVEGARQRRQATQAQLNRTIAAAYRVGASEQLLNLVTTDNPKIVLDRADSLARLGHDEGNQVAAAHTAEHELSVAETAVAGELASARRLDADLAAKKAEVEATWRQQQQLLAQLQDDQLAALAAAQDRAEQAAAAGGRPGSAASPPQPGDASAPTGSAGTAVAAAYAQLGKPYRWGAAGPVPSTALG